MTKTAKKFATPLNISVSKEIYDRAQNLQQQFDAVAWKKYQKRCRMSDLGEIVWNIGLGVLEALNEGQVSDTISQEAINEEMIKVEIRKAKKALKTPKSLSAMTDDQIEEIIHNKQSGGDD